MFIKKRIKYAWALLLLLICFCGCARVPVSTTEIKNFADKFHIDSFDNNQTPLGEIYAVETTVNPEASGAMLIETGAAALLHRIALARMASKTIDLQTYIYENDTTSRILMHEMKLAADRGVKVRILVDDLGLDSDHSDIILMNYHPNIEVRVFNTFRYRARILRYPQLILGLYRHNYRMHNKLFIVDNAAVIIGGRNVGGTYFDNSQQMNFSDTDVLFMGALASSATESFNEYWNYHLSIPVSAFPRQDKPEEFREMDEAIVPLMNEERNVYVNSFIERFSAKEFDVYWGKGILIGDPPAKVEKNMTGNPILELLGSIWINTEDSIYISSAYLVPGYAGQEVILRTKERGVNIKMLTNSLSSTDSWPVYAGWLNFRDELLDHGIEIYEFRNEGDKVERAGGSSASLHSKVIVFDDEITWVGSFNLDPRSSELNTEVIAAFYSPDFAKIMRKNIEREMSPDKSWELYINENGGTRWRTVRNGKEVTVDYSPDTLLVMRMVIGVTSIIIPHSML